MDCSTLTRLRVAFGCALTVTLLGSTASAAPARSRTHYLVVYNDDSLPALRVEIAPRGSGAFRQLDTSGSLAGGQIAHTTATYPDGLCSVDLRVTYAAPSPALTITDWDLCHGPKIHLGMARRAALASPAA